MCASYLFGCWTWDLIVLPDHCLSFLPQYKSLEGLPRWLGCLRSGLSWFNWLFLFLRISVLLFLRSSCLFYLRFNFDFYVSKIMRFCARNLPRTPNDHVSEEPKQN